MLAAALSFVTLTLSCANGLSFNSSMDMRVAMNSSDGNALCWVYSSDPGIHNKINELFLRRIKLIEYELRFQNYSLDEDPLYNNLSYTYKLHLWSRIASSHGKTLLSLAFNYGVLSLMTLSFGVIHLRKSRFLRRRQCPFERGGGESASLHSPFNIGPILGGY